LAERFVRAQLRTFHGECLMRQQRIEHLLGVIAEKDKQIASLEARLETARSGEVADGADAAYSGTQAPQEPG
jgi:hypothetical protein